MFSLVLPDLENHRSLSHVRLGHVLPDKGMANTYGILKWMSNCCKAVVTYYSPDKYLKCLASCFRWLYISWQYISCILKKVYVVKVAVIVWLHRLQDGITWLSWCLHQQIIPWNWQETQNVEHSQIKLKIYSSSSYKMCVYSLNSIVSWDCLRKFWFSGIFWYLNDHLTILEF